MVKLILTMTFEHNSNDCYLVSFFLCVRVCVSIVCMCVCLAVSASLSLSLISTVVWRVFFVSTCVCERVCVVCVCCLCVEREGERECVCQHPHLQIWSNVVVKLILTMTFDQNSNSLGMVMVPTGARVPGWPPQTPGFWGGIPLLVSGVLFSSESEK